MTSLEHAKVLFAQLFPSNIEQVFELKYIPIIQKAMEAYAEPFKDAVAAELRIARLVGENAVCKDSLDSMELLRQEQATELAQLKKQNRELLKDKEHAAADRDSAICALRWLFDLQNGPKYENRWKDIMQLCQTLFDKCEDKALDKAALAKGEL